MAMNNMHIYIYICNMMLIMLIMYEMPVAVFDFQNPEEFQWKNAWRFSVAVLHGHMI